MKLLLLSFIMLMVANISVAKSTDLNEYRWKNRVLLLFAPDSSHAEYITAQRQLEKHNAGVKERDLIIFSLLKDGESYRGEKALDAEFVTTLWETFSPKTNELTIVLIGKDGGEKLRQTGKMDLEEIFRRIDAMPMRRTEMREAQGK